MAKKMTRKEALLVAIDTLDGSIDNMIADNVSHDFIEESEEAIAVIKKMVASIDKQASRPKTKSQTRRDNEKLAREFIALIREHGKPVNATWMTENLRYCLTSQKAVAIARIAETWGAIEKITIKGRTYYEYVDCYQPLF